MNGILSHLFTNREIMDLWLEGVFNAVAEADTQAAASRCRISLPSTPAGNRTEIRSPVRENQRCICRARYNPTNSRVEEKRGHAMSHRYFSLGSYGSTTQQFTSSHAWRFNRRYHPKIQFFTPTGTSGTYAGRRGVLEKTGAAFIDGHYTYCH